MQIQAGGQRLRRSSHTLRGRGATRYEDLEGTVRLGVWIAATGPVSPAAKSRT